MPSKQHVYAMQDCDTGLIKFGISCEPEARASAIAKDFSANVEILGILKAEDAKASEKFIHKSLAEHRVMGEWFSLPESVKNYALAFFEPIKPKAKKLVNTTKKTHSSDNVNQLFREAAKKRMEDLGETQAEIARKLGIKRQYLWRMLNERVGEVPDKWVKLLDVLGLEIVIQPKNEI